MNKEIDLKQISIIILTCLIGSIIIYMFVSMIKFSDRTEENQVGRIEDVIKKASVTCYGLEGSYPTDVEYLAQFYGVILDKQKYEYYYEFFGYNQMPEVRVIEKAIKKGGDVLGNEG